jgi:ribosomal protein S18 acetylase RimI-like enzyme
MSELTFNAAGEQDVPIIVDLLSDATKYKLSLGDEVWGNKGWFDHEVRDDMKDSTVYLIKQNNEVVATVALQWNDERNWGPQPPVAGYMHRMAVKDGFHGQGLGAQIVVWAKQQAAEHGRQYLRLDCEAANSQLCAYYEKLGFVQIGTRPVPEYGDYVAALFEQPVSESSNLAN